MQVTYSNKPFVLDSLRPDAVVASERNAFHAAPGRLYRRTLWPADFSELQAAPAALEKTNRSSRRTLVRSEFPHFLPSSPTPQLPAGFPWWTTTSMDPASTPQPQVFLTELLNPGQRHERQHHDEQPHHSRPAPPPQPPSTQHTSTGSSTAAAPDAGSALRHALMGTTSPTSRPNLSSSSQPWPWPWDESQPRARPIPALLATLPPLSTLTSLSTLSTQLDHLSQHMGNSLAQLEVLSCLQTLSSLASLATIPTTQHQPPTAAPPPPPPPLTKSLHRGSTIDPPSVLYGSLHLSTTRPPPQDPAPSWPRPTANIHYLGYRTPSQDGDGSSTYKRQQQQPAGSRAATDPPEPPLLSRLYPHIDSAALEVDVAEEQAAALLVQAAQAAQLSARHVVPSQQMAGYIWTATSSYALATQAETEAAAAVIGTQAEEQEALDRTLILPLNIDCVAKPEPTVHAT